MKLESREVENSRGRPVEGPLLLQTCQDIVIDAQKNDQKEGLILSFVTFLSLRY